MYTSSRALYVLWYNVYSTTAHLRPLDESKLPTIQYTTCNVYISIHCKNISSIKNLIDIFFIPIRMENNSILFNVIQFPFNGILINLQQPWGT